MLGMKKKSVEIAEHDPHWEIDAQTFIAELKEILAGHETRIEHVGSTAVKGLAAKPIIDIYIGIKDPKQMEGVANAIAAADAGYTINGLTTEKIEKQFLPGNIFMMAQDGEQTFVNAHICVVGTEKWNRTMAARDYLTEFPSVAAEYAELKKNLAIKVDAQLKSGEIQFSGFGDKKNFFLDELFKEAFARYGIELDPEKDKAAITEWERVTTKWGGREKSEN
ncbi:MAG: GrpB family protein [Firmicutes bacterium]|nr:GrpB family protein [Bacillota bacterium]